MKDTPLRPVGDFVWAQGGLCRLGLGALAFAAFAGPSAAAGTDVPVSQITRVVTAFAKAQGCMVKFDPKNIVALDFEGERSFVVAYSIDVGCSGGSGLARPAIAVLAANYLGEVFIRPQFSAPTQASESLPRVIERIYLKEGRLWVSGKDFDPGRDALCCPSIRVESHLLFHDREWRAAGPRPKDTR